MIYRFDLVSEPWVPCVRHDGRVEERGLRDALAEAHHYRELGGESPLVTAALYRLLLAVLHRVFGPKSYDSWSDLWRQERWDTSQVDRYFAAWRHRFDLFDEDRPFFQASYPGAKPKSVSSLIHDMASGNNAVLFDHHSEGGGATLSPAEVARALVAGQAFGLGGLSGFPEKFTDGPCARGILFLVVGNTLFQTLCLNLLSQPDEDDPLLLRKPDMPCWEMPEPLKDEGGRPFGLQDRYTWLNRRVLLLPEQGPTGLCVRHMTWGPGLRLSEVATTQDPMKLYRGGDSTGWRELRFQEDRALWRDSAPLFRLSSEQKDRKTRPPMAIDQLAEIMRYDEIEGLGRYQAKRLLALGMANDQAKVEFFRREELPLPLDLLSNQDLVTDLEDALQTSETVRGHLQGAFATLACWLLFHKQVDRLSVPQKDARDRLMDSWGGERWYWSDLEPRFFVLLADLTDDASAARRAWARTLQRAAWDALEHVIDKLGTDPHALKAAVMARGRLGAGLNKELSIWLGQSEPTEKEVTHA